MVVRFQKPTKEFYILVGSVLLIILVIVVGQGFLKAKNAYKTTNNPQKAKEVALSLKEEVSKIYNLPPEDPVVATVTDTKVLPENDFYAKAKNGDKILLFEASKKVVLYRPGEKRVIDVGSLEAAPQPPAIEAVAGEQAPSTQSANIQTVPKVLFQNQQ